MINPSESMRSIIVDGWMRRLSIPNGIRVDHYFDVKQQADRIDVLAKNKADEDLVAAYFVNHRVLNEFEFKQIMRKTFDEMAKKMEQGND